MKIIAGTNRKKKEIESKREEISEETKQAEEPKIPDGAKDLSHTVKRIHNGYVKTTSYRHPKTDSYEHHEIYYETDPFALRKAKEKDRG